VSGEGRSGRGSIENAYASASDGYFIAAKGVGPPGDVESGPIPGLLTPDRSQLAKESGALAMESGREVTENEHLTNVESTNRFLCLYEHST